MDNESIFRKDSNFLQSRKSGESILWRIFFDIHEMKCDSTIMRTRTYYIIVSYCKFEHDISLFGHALKYIYLNMIFFFIYEEIYFIIVKMNYLISILHEICST